MGQNSKSIYMKSKSRETRKCAKVMTRKMRQKVTQSENIYKKAIFT